MMDGPHSQPERRQDALQDQSIPLDRATAREVVKLAEVDINTESERIGGWHGTSQEAIEHALRLGVIAPSAIAHAAAEPGHLFYFPAEPIDFNPATDLAFQFHGRGGAMGYAEGNAAYHFLMKRFELDFAKHDDHRLVMELLDGILCAPRSKYTREALSELGVPSGEVRLFMEEVKSRKGFLIAISHSAFEQWKPSEGDQPEADKKIFVPAGLPLNAVVAIQPLGSVEQRFIDGLRETLQVKS